MKAKIQKLTGVFPVTLDKAVYVSGTKRTLKEEIADIRARLNNTYNSVADMKKDNSLKEGEQVKTLGYYTKGDGGASEYSIISSATANDINIIALDNGLFAKLIVGSKLYAKQYGVKMDGVTDDTVRLNKFFEDNRDSVELIVNNGCALITDTLFIFGKWREDIPSKHDNSIKRIKFENARILYKGTENKCAVFFYYHFQSHISGLAIDVQSANCYVDMTMVWHSEFSNFFIPNLCMNKDISILTTKGVNSVESPSVMTCQFRNGFTRGACDFKTFEVEKAYINLIRFSNVGFNAYGSDYCVGFNGDSFQDMTFDTCDLSGGVQGTFKVENSTSLSMSAINTRSCYYDLKKPVFVNNDPGHFMYSSLQNHDNEHGKAGLGNVTGLMTPNIYLKHGSLFGTSQYGDFLPIAQVNCAKNGNLGSTDLREGNGWEHHDSTKVTFEFVKTEKNESKNALRLTYGTEGSNIYFHGIKAPYTGLYTFGLHLKKVSGSGALQMSNNGVYFNYDFASIKDGEEIIIANNTSKRSPITEGTALAIGLSQLPGSTMENLVLEIYEIFMIPGTLTQLGTRMHKDCDMSKVVIPTGAEIKPTYASNIDLDNIAVLNQGFYTSIGMNHQGTVPSRAITVFGINTPWDAGSVQMGFTKQDNGMYFRNTNNGAFSEWEKVVTDKSFESHFKNLTSDVEQDEIMELEI